MGDEKLHRAFLLSQLNPWRRSTCAVFSASESDSALGMLSSLSPHVPSGVGIYKYEHDREKGFNYVL